MLRTPARSVAEPTNAQLTSVKNAVVPTIATAVCAIVLIARIAAAFNQFLPSITLLPLFEVVYSVIGDP